MTSRVRKGTSPDGVLGDLGFTGDQEIVYRVLLEHGWESLAATAARTGLGQANFQNCVDTLAEWGVVRVEGDRLTVADPVTALGSLIERREDALMTAYRQVSSLRSMLSSFVAARSGDTTDPPAEIERLDGVDSVRERIAELSFFARHSVMAIHPGGPQSETSIKASRPLDRRAARRGMRVQVIHEMSVIDDEVNRSYLQELAGLGVQVRLIREVPKRLIILDGEVALVPVDPQNSRAGALVVRQPSLITGLVDLFQRTWDTADSLGSSAEQGEDGHSELDDRDRRMLVLLASGSTDESIARELEISVRHLRRQIARVLAALGAQSRFEAGVEAARRGWI